MFVCATGACVSITYEAHKSGCSVIVLRCGYVFFESNLMSNVYVVQMLPDVPKCSHGSSGYRKNHPSGHIAHNPMSHI